VIDAVDGAESVTKVASERPDLVLMDIQLLVLDGYNATRQMKALPVLQRSRSSLPSFPSPWRATRNRQGPPGAMTT
jgi:CheY-like chemotaxis protein